MIHFKRLLGVFCTFLLAICTFLYTPDLKASPLDDCRREEYIPMGLLSGLAGATVASATIPLMMRPDGFGRHRYPLLANIGKTMLFSSGVGMSTGLLFAVAGCDADYNSSMGLVVTMVPFATSLLTGLLSQSLFSEGTELSIGPSVNEQWRVDGVTGRLTWRF